MAFTNGPTARRGVLISSGPKPAGRSPLPDCGRPGPGRTARKSTPRRSSPRLQTALAAIHDRMPVIVAPDAFNLWLDCATVDETTAAALMTPAEEALLECYAVSIAVNRAANNSASLSRRRRLRPRTVPRQPTRRRTAKARRPSLAILDVYWWTRSSTVQLWVQEQHRPDTSVCR